MLLREVSMWKPSALRKFGSFASSHRAWPLQCSKSHIGLFPQIPRSILASSLRHAFDAARSTRIDQRQGCTGSSASRTVQAHTKRCGSRGTRSQCQSEETCEKIPGVLLGLALLRGCFFSWTNREASKGPGFVDYQQGYGCSRWNQQCWHLHCRRYSMREFLTFLYLKFTFEYPSEFFVKYWHTMTTFDRIRK